MISLEPAADTNSQREAILVLGMHRSGTSSIAGVLAKCGADLPKTVMPAMPGNNERGFFESTVLAGLNDDILKSAGTSWEDWRSLDPGWFESPLAPHFRERAKALVTSEFGSSPFFVLKDPRICRLPDFWLGVLEGLNVQPKIVIPLRSPLEVAWSLNRRDRIGVNCGLLLWLQHVLQAERASRGRSRAILDWPKFLADWRHSLTELATALDVRWPRLSPESLAEIESFLEVGLHHNRVSRDELGHHPEIHRWVITAYDALLHLTREPHSPTALEALDDLNRQFSQASELFGRALWGAERLNQVLREEVSVLQQASAHHELALQQRSQEVQQLEKARDEAAQRAVQLSLVVDELRQQNVQLAQHNANLASSLNSLQEELSRETSRAADITAKHDVAVNKLEELRVRPVRTILRAARHRLRRKLFKSR